MEQLISSQLSDEFKAVLPSLTAQRLREQLLEQFPHGRHERPEIWTAATESIGSAVARSSQSQKPEIKAYKLIAHLLPPSRRGLAPQARAWEERILEPDAHNRAPNARKRMTILNRDNRRCKICGRKPDDYVDLEINVHHIRPWAKGGSTETSNLITLCDTCHDGLDPHFDPSLFDLVEQHDGRTLLNSLNKGAADYRRVIAEEWDRLAG